MAAADLSPGFDQTNLKMLEEQLLCDIIFEAGGERIGAHKFILASRNSTFRYKFLEAPNEIYLDLADKDPNIVWTFFRYLYTGMVEVNAVNANALLDIAEEYQAEDLIGKCISVLASSLTPESACIFMKYHKYAPCDVVENCIKFIVANSKVLYTDLLAALPQPCLQAVLASEGLGLPEEKVYEIAIKWAEDQCGLQNLVVRGGNLRKVLGDAFFEIRFPIMNKDYFMDHVSNNGILSTEEGKGILLYMLQKKAGALNLPFKAYQRGNKPKLVLMRFQNEKPGWHCQGQKKDAICFLPSVAITLHGIKIYGKCDQAGQLNASVILQDNIHSHILTSVTAQLQTNTNESLYDVLFNQPVVLNRGVEYHIICTLEGGKTYFGNDGRETVNENGVEFKFKRSLLSTNSTVVNQGQIPGLIYSL